MAINTFQTRGGCAASGNRLCVTSPKTEAGIRDIPMTIYRKQGDEEKCAERIAAMERIWSIPSGIFDTTENQIAQKKSIRDDLTYEYAIYKDKIAEQIESGSKSLANEYRFNALYSMIGYGVTGLYPQLEEHKDELEQMIDDYIQLLR